MSDMLSFHLPDAFVEEYANRTPEWGFPIGGGQSLSELIYVDKYSALKEDGTKERWHETVRRCVEGYYSILKDHCKSNRTPWNDFKAMASAKDAYDRMWAFKWLPPGRGLQHMGRPIVHEEGISNALQNPLHEDTNVLTREGWKRLGDLEGTVVEVLTSAHLYAREPSDKKNFISKWTKAEISEIEYQPCVRIEYRTTLGEVKSIVASRNHRWFTKNAHHHNWKRVTSEELEVEGFLPTVRPHKNFLPSLVGMQHGFFFGDGSRTTGELEQFGASVAVLSHLFGHHVKYRDRCGWVGQLPLEWGKTPSGGYADDQRYMYGFLAGYFAADGCVGEKGHMTLSSARLAELREVQRIFLDLGIEASDPKLTSTSSNFAEERELWVIRVNRFDVTEEFFLLQHHRERWLASTYGKSRTKKYARIISIEDAGVQPVLCATVPEYEQFVTEDFILTSNCSFTSTGKLSAHSVKEAISPFVQMMEESSWGIGVGFDTRGAGRLTIHQPSSEHSETFVVPDNREGWAESVGKLLESYFFKNRPEVAFDYSQVRPAGALLKRFGGRASGPGPLMVLHESIRSQLEGRSGETITSRDILDIMNKIGKAIQAGGARRSAQICFGEPSDSDYVNAKNWNLPENAERTGADGWAFSSNNSVFVSMGDDYEPMIEGIIENGEPGFMWLDLARRYGRLVDPANNRDYRVAGGNPCFSGETLIAVADGRNAVSIAELAETGDDVPVYSLNTDNGQVEIKWARNPRKTRSDAELVEVRLHDGTSLRVTPDHKFVLRDGTIRYAKDLQTNDSLPAFNKRLASVKKGGNDYYRVGTDVHDGRVGVFEHRLIARFNDPEKWDEIYDETKANGWIKGGLVVHHKDYDPLNNSPDNLEIMTHKDHVNLHASFDRSGENNGMFGREHSEQTKAKIGAKTRERFATEEDRRQHGEKIAAGMGDDVRQKISDARNQTWTDYYLEQEASTDLDTVWIDGRLYAVKSCMICDDQMVLEWRGRHAVFCSHACMNKNPFHVERRAEGLRKAHDIKSQEKLERQISCYLDLLVELGREPMRAEWENECKERGVPRRFQKNSDNPHIPKSFSDLKQRAAVHNHRVVEVVKVDDVEDVYNLTVDDNATVGLITRVDNGFKGVFSLQCLEQSLEDGEKCTLVETFPSKHDSFEDYRETLKHAYLYGKAVTLLPTSWPESNEVMARNRRIGCSASGLAEFVESRGWSELRTWLDEGYQFIVHRDQKYSEWLAVRESIKKTSIKPSGTVSLVAGVTPGVHWPVASGYYIRRVRFSVHNPMVETLREAGYKVEPAQGDPDNTVVVEFITKGPNVRNEREVTVWEKAELAVMTQRWWADNQVSATLTFLPDERDQILPLLASKEGQFKGVSFLPLGEEATYPQQPYEKTDLSPEQIELQLSSYKPLGDLYKVGVEAVGDKYCDSDVCTI